MSVATGSRLVWEKGDGSKVEFPLTEAIHLVGREDPADIQVSEPLVSRSHARLERRGEAWVVIDLGSTNFTRVNGNRIGEAELQDGDEVRFGRARCVFRHGGPDSGGDRSPIEVSVTPGASDDRPGDDGATGG